MSGWNPLAIAPPPTLEVLCGLSEFMEMLAKFEIGQAIRGKLRILDGKDESGLDHKFGASWW
jgi:hypothetical protein